MNAFPMLILACALLASGVPAQVDEAPSEAEAAAVAEALAEAFRSRDVSERRAAVERSAGTVHPIVIKRLTTGLKDKDASVRLATIEALGAMPHEDALAELHRHYRSNRKALRRDTSAFAALFKAIGRHGHPSSIEILEDKPWDNTDATVVKARIYGLGNIRDVRSVEALIGMMNKGKPLPGEDAPFMPDFHVALARLTGTDQTTNKSLWQDWWRKNRRGFEVAEQPAELPRDVRQAWSDYWGLEEESPAAERRQG